MSYSKETVVIRENTAFNTFYFKNTKSSMTIILVNALGMPFELIEPLFQKLSESYSVLSWETPGEPVDPSEAFLEDTSITGHCCDIRELLKYFQVTTKVALWGWCTGAHIAMRYAHQHPEDVDHLVMISGTYNTRIEELRSDHEKNFFKLMKQLSVSHKFAEIAYKVMRNGNVNDYELAQNAAEMIHQASDDRLNKYTRVPYSSADKLFNYARVIAGITRDRKLDWVKDIDIPAVFVSGAKDEITLASASKYVADLAPSAKYIELKSLNHYVPYYAGIDEWRLVFSQLDSLRRSSGKYLAWQLPYY